MRMVEPEHSEVKVPTNQVHFHCSPQMTDIDIKNYLQKIYKVQVADVNSYIKSGTN